MEEEGVRGESERGKEGAERLGRVEEGWKLKGLRGRGKERGRGRGGRS